MSSASDEDDGNSIFLGFLAARCADLRNNISTDSIVRQLQTLLRKLSEMYLSGDQRFLSSRSAPGIHVSPVSFLNRESPF